MTTIKDIANRLDISTASVSRAINNKEGVSQELRKRIKKVAEELGYHPDWNAKALVRGRTGVIGVVIPRSAEFTFSNPFYPLVLKGMGKIANKLDYNILLSFEGNASYASLYLKRLVDGMIVVAHRMDDHNIEELEEKNIPTVLIPGHVEGIESKLASVDAENVMSVFRATDHLIKLGHKRIAFIVGASNSRYTLERMEGYRKAFEQNNLMFRQQYVIQSDFSRIEGYKKMSKLLMRKDPPTAVIGINDAVTIGAIQAINKKRLNIPKDISVVTIGDSEYANGFFPPLTAIQVPMVEIGKKATLTLIRILDGVNLKKKRIVLPSEFVVRKSTDISSDLTS